jgi:large subunit ribosomal protein L35
MKTKMKSRKAITKRFKITGSGKLKRKQANKNHKAWGRTVKQRRQARKSELVSASDQKRINQAFQG